jgi:hypothetical protein
MKEFHLMEDKRIETDRTACPTSPHLPNSTELFLVMPIRQRDEQ